MFKIMVHKAVIPNDALISEFSTIQEARDFGKWYHDIVKSLMKSGHMKQNTCVHLVSSDDIILERYGSS